MRTKLAAYLDRTKISHRALAAKAGIPHLHPMISQWASAKRLPGLDAAVGLEEATGGEVPASYWRKLRRLIEARAAAHEVTRHT